MQKYVFLEWPENLKIFVYESIFSLQLDFLKFQPSISCECATPPSAPQWRKKRDPLFPLLRGRIPKDPMVFGHTDDADGHRSFV